MVLLEAWDKTVVEEPPGEKQIDYHEDSDQWVPRGDVLRCIIDDGGPDGEVVIHIDDQELSPGNSAGCSACTPDGACGSRSFPRNSSPRIRRSRCACLRGARAEESADGSMCRNAGVVQSRVRRTRRRHPRPPYAEGDVGIVRHGINRGRTT